MNSSGTLQRLGKALMMPISIIAAAGIFLGLAAALQNPAIVGDQFIHIDSVQHLIGFIRKIAGTLFANLPILFAVAVSIGMAKDEKPTAAFAGVIGFLMMHVAINFMLGLQGINPATVSVDYLVKLRHDTGAGNHGECSIRHGARYFHFTHECIWRHCFCSSGCLVT